MNSDAAAGIVAVSRTSELPRGMTGRDFCMVRLHEAGRDDALRIDRFSSIILLLVALSRFNAR